MFNASIVPSFVATFAFLNTALSLPLAADLISYTTQTSTSVPRLVQYVQTFHTENSQTKHLSLLPLLTEQTGVTHVILAALHIDGPNGNITLNDNNPNSTYYEQTWSEVATLQQNGIKVMVMMGGEAQGSYSGRLCSSNGSVQDSYYLPLVSTLKYHNIDGLDLDIEEVVPISCPQNLVQRLHADLGPEFILTMAPVASDLTSKGGSSLAGFSYSQFDKSSAGSLVNWYNGQYYSGFVEGSLEQSYSNAINNGYSPERVVMGVLDSKNDGSGFVSLGAVQETIANLKTQYSNFGGVDGWEWWDAGISDNLSKPWMWTKLVGQALFKTSSKRCAGSQHHTPTLPEGVARLMAEGYGQIEAAKAVRLREKAFLK